MSDIAKRAAARYCSHQLWLEAGWIATTYRCHPTDDAPPVMGLVFADPDKGLKLFATWTNDWGNQDQNESIRIVVIEGEISDQAAGYTIRLSADSPNADTGQVQRMHPSPETEAMFGQFKAQYLQHGEFLLCPVIQKDDGQLWFNANAGIIKRHIEFRNAEDISEGDIDAIVLEASPAEQALASLIEQSKAARRENQD